MNQCQPNGKEKFVSIDSQNKDGEIKMILTHTPETHEKY